MRLAIVFKNAEALRKALDTYQIGKFEREQLASCSTKITVKTGKRAPNVTRREFVAALVWRAGSRDESDEKRPLLPRMWMTAAMAIYSLSDNDTQFAMSAVKRDLHYMDKMSIDPFDLENALRKKLPHVRTYDGRMGVLVQAAVVDKVAMRQAQQRVADYLDVPRTHRLGEANDTDMDSIVNAFASIGIRLPDDVADDLYFTLGNVGAQLHDVVRWAVQQKPLFDLVPKTLIMRFTRLVYEERGFKTPSHLSSQGMRSTLIIGNGKLTRQAVLEFLYDLETKFNVKLDRERLDDVIARGLPLYRVFDIISECRNYTDKPWMLEPNLPTHAQIFQCQKGQWYLVTGKQIEFVPVRNVAYPEQLGQSPETMSVEGKGCEAVLCANKQDAEYRLIQHYAKQLEEMA